MKQRGFTVIELVLVAGFLIFAGSLFWIQTNNLQTEQRDEKRKIAINAIYYSLEESYFKANNYYPEYIEDETLTTLDPELLVDQAGIKLGQTVATIEDQEVSVQSEYRYEPTSCVDGKCKAYTLRADLESEDDFVKTNRSNEN